MNPLDTLEPIKPRGAHEAEIDLPDTAEQDSESETIHVLGVDGAVLDTEHHVGMIDVTDPDVHSRDDIVRCAERMRAIDEEVSVISVVATDDEGQIKAQANLRPEKVGPVCESSLMQSAVNEIVGQDGAEPQVEIVKALDKVKKDVTETWSRPHAA